MTHVLVVFEAAVSSLGAAYRDAYGPIDCG